MKTIYKINKTQINTIAYTFLKLVFLSLICMQFSCNSDESCDYSGDKDPESCVPFGSDNRFSGFTVATMYAKDQVSNVGVIYDTQNNSQAPQGDDWGTTTSGPQVTATYPTNWNANDIGQIFGITIDNNENVYLASSDIYFSVGRGDVPSTSTNTATIYQCNPGSGFTAVPFITLPSTNDALNDIGNIAYDKVNDQIFATNLEDGKIYRISISTATILETYDPWTDDSLDVTPIGIVEQDERIWAIGVNYESGNVKVYFPRVTSSSRSMYSITLQNDGSFPTAANSEVIEFANISGAEDIISDIAFSGNSDEMILTEKGGPHSAKTMSYSKIGAWSFNKDYFVGDGASGLNSSGGVDFAYTEIDEDISAVCDEFFWNSGNLMSARNSNLNAEGLVYGIQGISYSGNNPSTDPAPTANQDTDLYIDFDGSGSWNIKGAIGDVEVFDANTCFCL